MRGNSLSPLYLLLFLTTCKVSFIYTERIFFVIPVMEYWLEWEIAQLVYHERYPPHHEQMLYHRDISCFLVFVSEFASYFFILSQCKLHLWFRMLSSRYTILLHGFSTSSSSYSMQLSCMNLHHVILKQCNLQCNFAICYLDKHQVVNQIQPSEFAYCYFKTIQISCGYFQTVI